MKRIAVLLWMVVLLGITACNFKEEAAASLREVVCEEAEVIFTLNGLWKDEKEGSFMEDGRQHVFCASKEDTDSGIDILCEDLTRTKGATLVRIEDYVEEIREAIRSEGEKRGYTYTCSDSLKETLYGKEYVTFLAQESEQGFQQRFYIRRKENTIIVMIVSAFGEEKIEDILALGKEM